MTKKLVAIFLRDGFLRTLTGIGTRYVVLKDRCDLHCLGGKGKENIPEIHKAFC